MEVVLPFVLTAAGVLGILFAWNRLLVHLAMPWSVGEWLLATFWLPCLAGLPLLGLLPLVLSLGGQELSSRGVSFTLAALAGTWLLSVVTSVWSCITSLKARRAHEELAAAHGFKLSAEIVKKDLLPADLVYINTYVRNFLMVHERGFLANAATTAGKGGSGGGSGGLRFATVVVIEGIVVRAPVIISRRGRPAKRIQYEKQKELLELIGLVRLEVDGSTFSVSVGASLEEIKSHRKTARAVGESLLKLVASQLPDFLENISSIYVADGRIVILMRERVRDLSLLEQCVRCVEVLSMWSPTAKPV